MRNAVGTVFCAAPMWPGIFLPLITRDGSVPGPMEPGFRCRVLPCEPGPPPKPWRFTTPWKPRPLVVPVTFTRAPCSKPSTVTLSPTVGAASKRNSFAAPLSLYSSRNGAMAGSSVT